MKSVYVYILVVCMLMYGMISTKSVHGQASDSINTYQNIPKDPQTIQAGKTLFCAQCAECHAIGHEIIGPSLASVHTRRPLPWLVSFIQNSQAVIQGGDGYANFMYEQYRQTVMPAMEFLREDEIISILAYIQYESAPPTAKGGVTSQTQSEYFENDDIESYLPPEALTKRKLVRIQTVALGSCRKLFCRCSPYLPFFYCLLWGICLQRNSDKSFYNV